MGEETLHILFLYQLAAKCLIKYFYRREHYSVLKNGAQGYTGTGRNIEQISIFGILEGWFEDNGGAQTN